MNSAAHATLNVALQRGEGGVAVGGHDVDLDAWRQAIVALPVEARAELAWLFSPNLLRLAVTEAIHSELLAMTVGRNGSARKIAAAVHLDLSRYAASAWRYEADRAVPANSCHGPAHRILRLAGGQVPSIETVRRVLRSGGSKKTAEIDPPSVTERC